MDDPEEAVQSICGTACEPMTQGMEMETSNAQGGAQAGMAPGNESGRSEVGRKETRVFGFLLLPRFSLLAFTSAVEPLRSANRLAGQRLYDWRLISRNGGPVASSGGIEVMTQAAMSVLDVALACGFVSASHFSKCYREFFGTTPREERAPPR